jgi:competence protein ComEC
MLLIAGLLLGQALPALVDQPADSLSLLTGATALALLALCVLARIGRAAPVAMPMLALAWLALGSAWWLWRIEHRPPNRLTTQLATAIDASAEPLALSVRAVALRSPAADDLASPVPRPRYLPPTESADVALTHVKIADHWHPAHGRLTLRAPVGALTFAAGDALQATGLYWPIRAPANPGQRDTRAFAHQRAHVGSLRIDDRHAVELATDAPATRDRLARLHHRLHAGAGALLDRALPADGPAPAGRVMLRAMLLGSNDPDLRGLTDALARLGLVHILSISGFHLAALAGLVLLLLRLLTDLSGTGGARLEAALAALAIGLYLLVVPAEAPVLRSGIMILVLLLAEASGRRYQRLSVLCWTACALLLWQPADLFSPGFQLSFLTTGVLLWRAQHAADRAHASLPGAGLPGVRGRIRASKPTLAMAARRLLLTPAAAGALAIGVSAPLVAFHTGLAPGWGVIVGLALAPLATLALLLGLIALPLAAVAPALATPIALGGAYLCEGVLLGARAIEHAPGAALIAGPLPALWALGATVVALAIAARLRPHARAPGPRALAMACAVLCAWLALDRWHLSRAPAPRLQVTRLALPGGAPALVRAGDRALLIDPGSRSPMGAPRVVRAAWSDGLLSAPDVLITSAKPERFAHLAQAGPMLRARTAWLPLDLVRLAQQRPAGPQAELLATLARQGVATRTYTTGEALLIGPLEVTVEADATFRLRTHDQPEWWRFSGEPPAHAQRRTLDGAGATEQAIWHGSAWRITAALPPVPSAR